MIVKTGRFGQLTVGQEEEIVFPAGVLGFPDLTRFCIVDPGDETLILWLQSMERPEIAFPILEPKIFKADYTARLSASELRELNLVSVNQSAVFCILTIPDDVSLMTANIKAPLVVNLKDQLARQVVLQENDYGIRHPIFKELKAHLLTISAQRTKSDVRAEASAPGAIIIKSIPPTLTARSLTGP